MGKSHMGPPRAQIDRQTDRQTEGQTDRHDRKHYLPATSLAGGN